MQRGNFQILISVTALLVSGYAYSKELSDLNKQEKSHLAVLGSLACLAKAEDSQIEHFKLNKNNEILEKMVAFFEIMKNRQGLSDTCKALYVDDLIKKPGSSMGN